MNELPPALRMAARGALLVSALMLAAAGADQRADPPSVHAAPAAGSGETPGADAPAARAGAGRIARWRVYTIEASRRFGIPLAWIEAVMRAESGGRTRLDGRAITSHAGAMGLMQLMPGTWAEMRARYGLGPDPHDPRGNILAGTAYLAELYRQFGHPGLFGAYNAGPARYSSWLAGRRALTAETRNYLVRLTAETAPGASFAAAKANAPPAAQAHSAPTRAQLFAVDRSPGAASPGHSSGDGLFVPLSADNLPLPQERSGP